DQPGEIHAGFRLRLLVGGFGHGDLDRQLVAPARSPSPGNGTGTPSWLYCFSLLRSVRMEMPRMFAAWVRLPRQCWRVSRIRSRSTSATVRPTSCVRSPVAREEAAMAAAGST